MRIYVGNLSYETSEEDLRSEFTPFGKVDSVSVVMDRSTGRSKGFAFVEMPTVSEGQAAIDALNGKTLKDRTLTVNAARPRGEGGSGGYQEHRSGGYGRGSGNNRGGYGGNRRFR